MSPAAPDAYVAGLRLLSRRELSSAALAARLARRGYGDEAIDLALGRLRAAGALDDGRAARAFATTFQRRGRGRRRVLHDVEAQGIDPGLARQAVSEAFAGVDERALMEAVIEKRAGGLVRDEAELRRLHRVLVRRGFASDAALALLRDRLGSRTGGTMGG